MLRRLTLSISIMALVIGVFATPSASAQQTVNFFVGGFIPRGFQSRGIDDVLVGRVREDETVANGLVLFLACDNLRKGAALNAVQIAELVLERRAVAA